MKPKAWKMNNGSTILFGNTSDEQADRIFKAQQRVLRAAKRWRNVGVGKDGYQIAMLIKAVDTLKNAEKNSNSKGLKR